VEKVLGEGGFGMVYLAHDDQLHRPVAIKVPRRHLVSDPKDLEANLAEARTVASLDHPHIVPVLDVGSTPEFPCFVVSKFIQGIHMRSYGELLHASGYGNRPKDFDDLIRILDGELRLITPTDLEGVAGDEWRVAGEEGTGGEGDAERAARSEASTEYPVLGTQSSQAAAEGPADSQYPVLSTCTVPCA
jgi:hypothetical protein